MVRTWGEADRLVVAARTRHPHMQSHRHCTGPSLPELHKLEVGGLKLDFEFAAIVAIYTDVGEQATTRKCESGLSTVRVRRTCLWKSPPPHTHTRTHVRVWAFSRSRLVPRSASQGPHVWDAPI